ncbi:major facilitator superfamily domain-containing protein [Mycena rosella]|uniref:Major facilitator superfamily domain-containing protein n=1 Tax=Mycena rosella TaxID=1033263 RepID=A0AAD7CQJ2_MYCRO|nr:major facilitator superfamily domain-containing protein [Mycena rosella]
MELGKAEWESFNWTIFIRLQVYGRSAYTRFFAPTNQLRTSAAPDGEKAISAHESTTVHSSTSIIPVNEEASNIVPWDGPEDGENPRNCLFTSICPVASSISSPALPAISAQLKIQPGSVLENMTLSIFVLAYAIDQKFGRLLVLQVFNTLCTSATTPTQLLVFRFLAGGAIVGDMWSPSERGMAMSLYSITPLVGPSTGPLVGGWIAQKSHWHRVFWSVGIADAILQIAAFAFLRETYAPELLRRKARVIRKSTRNPHMRSAFEDSNRAWTTVMGRGMVKPMIFLATEPIVQVFALYMAVLYGVLYLSLTTFVKVFTLQYGEGTGIAGVHYLSIVLGSTVGGHLGARVLTRVYLHLKAKNGGVDLGVFIFSIGIGANWTCIQTYLNQFFFSSYAIYAASAIAGVSSFRAFAGFGFPLFADEMYTRLGDGWGNSILALICLVIGCPAPFVFYRYGARLRARSKGSSVEQ